MKSLTPAVKRKITEDWSQCFVGLGIYQPLHLLRRVGPLLEGVVLERESGDVRYRPTFHVHGLTRSFPVVSMTLAHPLRDERSRAPESIPVLHHGARFAEAATRLLRQSPLPLSGNLRLGDVLSAYRAFLTRPGTHYQPELFEDMVAMCAWLGRRADAEEVLDEAIATMTQWPSKVTAAMGGMGAWSSRVTASIQDASGVRALADEQVRSLGAEQLPVAELVA